MTTKIYSQAFQTKNQIVS